MEAGFRASAPLIRTPDWRTKLHTLLHRPSDTPNGRLLRAVTFVVIVLSTLCFVLQSMPGLNGFSVGWQVIDGIVAFTFTVEYVAKVVVIPDGRGGEEYDGAHRPRGTTREMRLRFMREPMSIIDLLSILPFWLGIMMPFAAPWFLQLLRALRLVRVLRTLRLAQESAELRLLARCMLHALPALRMLCFFLVLDLLIVGGLVFHAERGHGPLRDGKWYFDNDTVAEFQSIPDAAWFALVTVTTVGYGREVPVTPMGKLITSGAMLSGLIGARARPKLSHRATSTHEFAYTRMRRRARTTLLIGPRLLLCCRWLPVGQRTGCVHGAMWWAAGM
jgi:voltage-gated potassium channel